MKQKVPLPWLLVHDQLRKLSEKQRHVPLDTVMAVAKKYGMPHAGLSLEQEVEAMLKLLTSLNSVLWYDSP